MAHEVHNGAENGGAKAVSFSAFKPQLFVQAPKAADAVQFYKAAFGAEEVSRTMHPKRKAEQDQPLVLSAELKLCSSIFSVSDISDESSSVGAGFAFCLETDDVEAAIGKALAAGAVAEGEVTEGEGAVPVSKVKDPYGFVWMFCSSAKSCGGAEA